MLSLVITGNPGVGKHTIAKKIAEMLDLDLLDLNQAAMDEKIFKERDGSRDVDVGMLKERIRPRLGGRSLVVGHLAPYVLAGSQVKKAVILRRSPYRLSAIYKKRNYPQGKARDNLESEVLGIVAHDMISKVGREKVLQIDTTGKSVRRVVLQTKDALNGKRKRGDPVDWLSVVSGRNDLREFFSYD